MTNKYNTVTKEQEEIAVQLFYAILPYYWKVITEIPTELKLRMALNHYTSIPLACMDIVNNYVCTQKLARKIKSDLRHTQCFGRSECGSKICSCFSIKSSRVV